MGVIQFPTDRLSPEDVFSKLKKMIDEKGVKTVVCLYETSEESIFVAWSSMTKRELLWFSNLLNNKVQSLINRE